MAEIGDTPRVRTVVIVAAAGIGLTSAGCKFSAPEVPSDAGAASSDASPLDAPSIPGDSSHDGQPVTHDGCTSFSSQLDTCQQTFGSPLTLASSACWDTGTHRLYDADCTSNPQILPHVVIAGPAGDVDFLLTTELTLQARLRVVGPIPFGILAPGAIVIGGPIDAVGSGQGGRAAGARDRAACAAGAGGIALDDAGGAPGGGGGAFRGAGGRGGAGDANDGFTIGGDPGLAQPLLAGPLGGCPGGAGGNGAGATGGEAGAGGGAVDLISGHSIDVTRDLNVSGGGGGGGKPANGGGGGGGSGGMILLEAPTVQIGGALAANGGGGGGGAGIPAGQRGQDGQSSATRATGGPRGGGGADGGAGGAGDLLDGATVIDVRPAGGGGAGGGVGYIAIKSTGFTSGGTISPAATILP